MLAVPTRRTPAFAASVAITVPLPLPEGAGGAP